MSLRVAIDTGGTFTDVVAINEKTGRQVAIKTPSTPSDPSIGLLEGIRKAAEATGHSSADVMQVLHGSTTATNAVLEHKFGGLGLLVTDGFRHMIEIARQSVPDGYGNSYFWVKPPRLVPLHLVREVSERMNFEGDVLRELDEDAVIAAIGELVEQGVKCLAVCLLHSYANPDHEKRIGELAREHFPDLFVSLSCEVLPEYREYERAMTTLIDVLVKPYCKTYLQNAADSITESAGEVPFLIMQSNGGVVKHATAGDKPVTMLLSGPAAGVLGAVHMCRLAGYEDILTLDVGGTSTDVALIDDLEPQMTSQSMIEHYPIKTPMLDIVTVGTGGGSLAWVDPYDMLKVGPQSSGAVPGPICYRRGGDKPTTTDACVVLGRLPHALVGGELELDVDGAREGYTKLGNKFNMTPEEVAAGVVEIAAANMVHGIRQVTTTRGRDPGNYAMIAFGGAGGMFACDVAEFLDIKTIISSPNPGNLSAFGLHVSDIKRDYIKTLVRQQSTADSGEIDDEWSAMEQSGYADIIDEGVAADKIRHIRSADVRYVGEGHEIPVFIPEGMTGEESVEYLWKNFHRAHMETFGFEYEGQQDVELVNLRVQAVGVAHRPEVEEINSKGEVPVPASTRKVFWRESGWIECDIYNRTDIKVGHTLEGPLVSEEYGSTVVVGANWTVRADVYGNLILERK